MYRYISHVPDFTYSTVYTFLPPGPVVRSMLSLLLILNCLLVGNVILSSAFGLVKYHLLEETSLFVQLPWELIHPVIERKNCIILDSFAEHFNKKTLNVLLCTTWQKMLLRPLRLFHSPLLILLLWFWIRCPKNYQTLEVSVWDTKSSDTSLPTSNCKKIYLQSPFVSYQNRIHSLIFSLYLLVHNDSHLEGKCSCPWPCWFSISQTEWDFCMRHAPVDIHAFSLNMHFSMKGYDFVCNRVGTVLS